MRDTKAPSQTIQYIENLYAPEDEILKSIRAQIDGEGRVGVNIGAVEGKILQILLRMNQVKTIVEVGTLLGYSALWMARALPEDGRLYTIEKNAHYAELARKGLDASEVGSKVEILHGDAALELMGLKSKGPFDMIFIDANKSSYCEILDWAMENVRKGGLIVADNTLLFGNVLKETKPDGISEKQWSEMRRFNKRLADQNLFTSVLLPTSEGLSVAIKNV